MKVKIIGHRGSVINGEENTLSAFEVAYNSGLKWVETDLRLTADNKIVLNHDSFNSGKEISLNTVEILKKNSSNKLITLNELLNKYTGKLNFDLDIKDSRVFQFLPEIIQHYSITKNILISSFDHATLNTFAMSNKSIQCAPIIASRPYSIQSIIQNIPFPFKKIIADADFCDQDMVKEFKKNEISVWLYSINSKDQAERFTKFGVSGLFINDPATFLNYPYN